MLEESVWTRKKWQVKEGLNMLKPSVAFTHSALDSCRATACGLVRIHTGIMSRC